MFTPYYYKQSHMKVHISVAMAYAELSKAKRLKVGAFIVRGDTPLAMGWNGRLPGECNECEDAAGNTLPDVRHAEINALNKLRRSNESSVGAILIQTHAPCLQCALDILDAHIMGVVYIEPYRDRAGLAKLVSRGMTVIQYDPITQVFYRHMEDGNLLALLPASDIVFNQWRPF